MIELHFHLTPEQEDMYETYFRPGAERDFIMIPHRHKGEPWGVLLQHRAQLMYETVKASYIPVAWADIDVCFVRPCANRLLELLEDYDLVSQGDGMGGMCFGIVVFRPTEITEAFLYKVAHDQEAYDRNLLCDQEASNKFSYMVKWKELPRDEFYSACFALNGGARPGWRPTTKDIPPDIRMFHANCVYHPEKMDVLKAFTEEAWPPLKDYPKPRPWGLH